MGSAQEDQKIRPSLVTVAYKRPLVTVPALLAGNSISKIKFPLYLCPGCREFTLCACPLRLKPPSSRCPRESCSFDSNRPPLLKLQEENPRNSSRPRACEISTIWYIIYQREDRDGYTQHGNWSDVSHGSEYQDILGAAGAFLAQHPAGLSESSFSFE